MVFADRRDAGRRLAEALERLRGTDPVVLGLPRGGVVVAAEVADRFAAPLDVIVVRKLGVPWQPELAMGALGEDGARVLDAGVLAATGVTPDQLAQVERQAAAEVADRVRRLRDGRSALPLQGRTVWIVDDGIATGSTVRAACAVARERGAAMIVVAVPVGPFGVAQEFAGAADEVVCLESPRDFHAVGQAYRDFGQTTDAEVAEILAEQG
jgi:predicted phosphoribosyltransferase